MGVLDMLAKVRACFMLARVRTPSSPVRERERKREREKETGALAPFRYLVLKYFRMKIQICQVEITTGRPFRASAINLFTS